MKPLVTIKEEKKFDVRIKTSGGGLTGQAGAASLAIARALNKCSPSFRSPLKKAGLMTRDPRKRERKKPGQPGARKRFQFSKR
jgi:small subunit ribosomal protein S9